ncbi:hypothetical protein SGRIM128S_01587 [Streptomyces griseomycini]
MTRISIGWSLVIRERDRVLDALGLVVRRDQHRHRFGDRRCPREAPAAGPAGVERGEQQHQAEAGDDEEADDGEAHDEDVGEVSAAWTRAVQAWPFHSSRPVTWVCALGALRASVRFSNA